MSADLDTLTLLGPEQETSCRGLVYRADVQHCATKKGFMFSVRLNKLKRLSCPGCTECQALEDDLSEIDPKHWPVLGVTGVEAGKLYRLRVANIGRDWESGYVDSWDLQLVPYEAEPSDESRSDCEG